MTRNYETLGEWFLLALVVWKKKSPFDLASVGQKNDIFWLCIAGSVPELMVLKIIH